MPGRPADRPVDGRLALAAGVAWAVLVLILPFGAPALVGCGVAAAVAGAVGSRLRRTGRRSAVFVLGCVASSAVLLTSGAQVTAREAGGVPELARQRAAVVVSGTIASDPRVLRAGPERRADSVILRLSVTEIVGRGRRSAVSTPVLVLAPGSWADRRWHESVRVSGRLRPADPGEDVVAVLTPGGDPEVLSPPGIVADAAEHVRERLRGAVAGLPPDAQGLVPGLVIGDTSLAPRLLQDDMKTTGLTHLSAVSGSNVAIVLAAALQLAGLVRLPRRARPAFAAALLVGFVVLARPEPSVIRAAVMGGVGLLGLQSARRGAGLPALGAAVLVLLVVDPWLARSFGFALSVLATAGLLVLARPWGLGIARRLPRRLGFLGEAIAIPTAAQVACAPVIVLLSGSISVVGVLANLLVAPLIGPATILGVAAALVATAHVGAGAVVATVAAVPVLGVAEVAHRCARLPYAVLPWPGGVSGALLLAGVTAAALATGPWLVWSARRRPARVLAAVTLAGCLVVPTGTGAWPDPSWRFAVCDVGQGDALVLRSGTDSVVVVDAGPTPGPVAQCLGRLGVRSIDAVVLTHLHDDHSGGIEGILDHAPVREVFLAPVDDPPADAHRVAAALSARGLQPDWLHAGDVLRWEGAVARVVAPRGRIGSGSVPNNSSVVLDVDVDGLRLLLLADAEREEGAQVRDELRRLGDPRPFDVVKVAHHGSANADRALLQTSGARAFAISVGLDNDFGHPAPSLLTILAGTAAPVYRTDRDGDLLFCRLDGALGVVLSKRRSGRSRLSGGYGRAGGRGRRPRPSEGAPGPAAQNVRSNGPWRRQRTLGAGAGSSSGKRLLHPSRRTGPTQGWGGAP